MIARDPGGRCSVGTGDRQDMMFARIGLTEVPRTDPIHCDDFKDDERVMYCFHHSTIQSLEYYDIKDRDVVVSRAQQLWVLLCEAINDSTPLAFISGLSSRDRSLAFH